MGDTQLIIGFNNVEDYLEAANSIEAGELVNVKDIQADLIVLTSDFYEEIERGLIGDFFEECFKEEVIETMPNYFIILNMSKMEFKQLSLVDEINKMA